MLCPQCNATLHRPRRRQASATLFAQVPQEGPQGGRQRPRATSQRPAVPSSLATSLTALAAACRLWVDDPLIGSGERPFVVTGIDANRVRLFSCAALVEIEVSRRDFDEHAESYESDPAVVLAILRRNIATAERHRLDCHAAAIAVERLLAEPHSDQWRLAA